MTFDGAIITEQGVAFAIAVVNSRESVRKSYIPIFGNIPIILAAQDSSGRFTYSGRSDIVNFLSNLYPEQIPWKRFTL